MSRLPARVTRTLFAALGGRTERVALAGFDLAVHRLGRPGGEPWVLLHGLGATGATFLPLLPALRRVADVVVPELAETGGSRGPVPSLAVADAVPIVAELVARSFPGRAITVAGSSLGGWVAIRLALAEPALAARLFLVSPGGYRDQDWEGVARAVTVESRADARRVLGALFARPPWALRLLPGAIASLYRGAPVRHLLGGALGPEDAFGDEELARVAAPTALLWGAEDGIFPLSTGEAMARALPRATFYPVSGAAHLPHWERRRETLAALADFRRRHPAPARAPRSRPPLEAPA